MAQMPHICIQIKRDKNILPFVVYSVPNIRLKCPSKSAAFDQYCRLLNLLPTASRWNGVAPVPESRANDVDKRRATQSRPYYWERLDNDISIVVQYWTISVQNATISKRHGKTLAGWRGDSHEQCLPRPAVMDKNRCRE